MWLADSLQDLIPHRVSSYCTCNLKETAVNYRKTYRRAHRMWKRKMERV